MFSYTAIRRKKSGISLGLGIVVIALPFAQYAKADDVACAQGSGTNIDTRSFPSTPGDTVLNGRQDGSPDTCIIFGGNIGK